MNIKLLTAYNLELLCITEGCTGSSESTLAKKPHCWKSHITAQISYVSCPDQLSTIHIARYS